MIGAGQSQQTRKICEQYEVMFVPSKAGRGCQQNLGASKATRQNLLFLHSDTKLPQTIESDLQKIHAGWGFFKISLDNSKWQYRVIETMMNVGSEYTSVATGDQCLFVQTKIFQQQRGFAEIKLMEDIELCKRLRQIAKPQIITHRVHTSVRRWQQNGILKTIILMWWLRLCYFLGVSPNKLYQIYYP